MIHRRVINAGRHVHHSVTRTTFRGENNRRNVYHWINRRNEDDDWYSKYLERIKWYNDTYNMDWPPSHLIRKRSDWMCRRHIFMSPANRPYVWAKWQYILPFFLMQIISNHLSWYEWWKEVRSIDIVFIVRNETMLRSSHTYATRTEERKFGINHRIDGRTHLIHTRVWYP